MNGSRYFSKKSKYEQMYSKLSAIWNLIRSQCCHPFLFVPFISFGHKVSV